MHMRLVVEMYNYPTVSLLIYSKPQYGDKCLSNKLHNFNLLTPLCF